MERHEHSVIEDHGLYASSCGYCKSNGRTSIAYGLWSHSLSLLDYQDLLNRGWRRSGMFLYRPEMEKTCCPAYTIRLKVDSFSKSKEQIRVIRRMQRYLDGTYNALPSTGKGVEESKKGFEILMNAGSCGSDIPMSRNTSGLNDSEMNGYVACGTYCKSQKKVKLEETDSISRDLSYAIKEAINSCILAGEFPAYLEIPKIILRRVHPSLKRRIKTLSGEACYTCNVAFLCAAALSKHRDVHKIGANTSDRQHQITQGITPAVLAESIASKLRSHDGLCNFKVEACKGHLNFLSMASADSDFSETAKSCSSSSVDGEGDSNNRGCISAKGFLVAKSNHVQSLISVHTQTKHNLEIRMRRSAFDPEEFALYKKYQVAVHHDQPEDVKESSYRRFLVDTPLTYVPPAAEGTSFCGFGSFHQQYLIDGLLVAVGVVDILPSCLSSKYLFWDPDLALLSLGKYSALQEIEWVQEARRYCPTMEYYYLGYYIHSCPKMRYKAAYRPSELLCPVRFQWVPFEIACPLLDKQAYVCLSDYLDTSTTQRSSKYLHLEQERSAVLDENEWNDEPCDVDINEVEGQKAFEIFQNVELASSSKESEDVCNVLLKLGKRYLRFKHLQTWFAVPQKHVDALACDLRKYSQVVGPTLAARMAYALG